jgi:tetratricopeptide (TPR) repeat protein
MASFRTFAAVSVFLCGGFFFQGAAGASDKATTDPNAALRRANPPNRAMEELARVQKINNELAVQHFTGVIKKDPKNAIAFAKRGKAYAALQNHENALKDYDKAIRLDASLADAYVGRAVARYLKQDYDGSWQDVHKAESLGGKFWPAFLDALKEKTGRDK